MDGPDGGFTGAAAQADDMPKLSVSGLWPGLGARICQTKPFAGFKCRDLLLNCNSWQTIFVPLPWLAKRRYARAKQDIAYPLFISGPARPRDKPWNGAASRRRRSGPGTAPILRASRHTDGAVSVTGGGGRRRSRQAASPPKAVQFSMTEAEFAEVSEAAAWSGLARGAFAAEATLAAARGEQVGAGVPLREALVEMMTAAGLVRRIGNNLNQAVARLNATGQRSDDLLPAAQFCVRVIRRLDDAAKQLRRSIP